MPGTSRRWCFTLNNPTKEEFDNVLTTLEWKPSIFKFGICQLESGSGDQTLHLQGYLETTMPLQLTTVKNKLGTQKLHLEKAQGTKQQNIDYCSKSDTKIEGPWSFGDAESHQGSRSDLKAVADDIKAGKSLKEIANDHPVEYIKYGNGIQKTKNILEDHLIRNDIQIIVHYGPTNTGKTTKVWKDEKEVYALPIRDPKQPAWFDGYDGQDALLIDDYYGRDFTWDALLKLLDRFPTQVAVKGTHSWAKWHKVYITTNAEPWRWYKRAKPTKSDQAALFRRITAVRKFKKDFTWTEMDGPTYLLDFDLNNPNGADILPDGYAWPETVEILEEVHVKMQAAKNVFNTMMEAAINKNSTPEQNIDSDGDDEITIQKPQKK